VGRLSEKHPHQFGSKQHSIVQRLLKALRRKASEKLLAEEPLGATAAAPAPGAVDGSGYRGAPVRCRLTVCRTVVCCFSRR
jgi:hypothetical protein